MRGVQIALLHLIAQLCLDVADKLNRGAIMTHAYIIALDKIERALNQLREHS